MVKIARQLDQVANEQFDLIVVGGGIYGACVALESARRGLRPLLLERDDFGGGNSWNSLRIVHGGLRYLQNFDIPRFRRSVTEQAWWLNHFFDQVQPLPCLLPLYNRGLRSTQAMRTALWMNDQLAALVRRQRFGGPASSCLPKGHVVSRRETIDRFPSVDPNGLCGGAVWYDAHIAQPQRLQMEVLRWAVACGAVALNYTECDGVLEQAGLVTGVTARCRETGRGFEFRAPSVVNCAGPWAREVAEKAAGNRGLALAFNVTLSRPPLSSDALAVTPKRKDGPTYFLVPYGRQTMVGTVHLPLADQVSRHPTVRQISDFLDDINRAIPEYEISLDEVMEVLAGRLPARATDSPASATSPLIVHHDDHGGPRGLVSVTGVKYTTARAVAERTLTEMLRRQGRRLMKYGETVRPEPALLPDLDQISRTHVQASAARGLQAWMTNESVLHIDDLLLRRYDCRRDPQALSRLAETIMQTVGWDRSRRLTELERLACSLPTVAKTQAC